MKRSVLTAVIEPEEDGFVSICPEFDIASQGATREEASRNLAEAIEGFLEVASDREVGLRLENKRQRC